jgi:hypothetical protein
VHRRGNWWAPPIGVPGNDDFLNPTSWTPHHDRAGTDAGGGDGLDRAAMAGATSGCTGWVTCASCGSPVDRATTGQMPAVNQSMIGCASRRAGAETLVTE